MNINLLKLFKKFNLKKNTMLKSLNFKKYTMLKNTV